MARTARYGGVPVEASAPSAIPAATATSAAAAIGAGGRRSAGGGGRWANGSSGSGAGTADWYPGVAAPRRQIPSAGGFMALDAEQPARAVGHVGGSDRRHRRRTASGSIIAVVVMW